MATVLVIEDDESLRTLTAARLEGRYEVLAAGNGKEALGIIESKRVDLVVADIMMPVMSGYDFVREIRSAGIAAPVILATAKQEFGDKANGFNLGADDYMVKPINYDELILRIDALLRRSKIASDKEIVAGAFKMSAATCEASYKGENIEMTRKEFDLLYKLLSYPNRVFAHEKLLNEVWGYDCPSDETTIRSHVNRLRNKLEGVSEFEIKTVRGLGYKAVIK